MLRRHTSSVGARFGLRRRLAPAIALAAVVLATSAGAAPAALPPIRHVFVIVLENESASTTFSSSSPAPYLAKTLVSQGAYIPNYYGIGHASLDNYIAMISGQAPNPTTQADCQMYTDVTPGTPTGSDDQVNGPAGCVYPAAVKTLPDQLEAAVPAHTWRGYMQDMGNDPVRDSGTTCAHPAFNSSDMTQSASATDQYATRHDPFVYFHSIIDNAPRCAAGVVPLTQLDTDLQTAAQTPDFVFITPDLCNDGHDATCADGSAGGLTGVNNFLSAEVPKIVGSPAFQQGSLLAIIFDEAASSDATACCSEMSGPNTLMAGETGPGGGDTGAVLLSQFIAPATVTQTQYNHYSLLRSYEDIFGVPHLGYAGAAGLTPLGSDVFTAPAGRALTADMVSPSSTTPPATTPAAATPSSPPTAAAQIPPTVAAPLACPSALVNPISGGRLVVGRTVSGVRVTHSRTSARLRLTARHTATTTVLATRRGGRARHVGPSRLKPCWNYSIALPGRHGTVRILLSVGRAHAVVTKRY